ncbi:hypothetical protein CVT26_007095 [Gymnopilus dilepis]|uniref:RING-type domain-containing protein n=1 Tax=Gymnopilus dilepis TaxID=231916 RepID=A0A409VNN7_9AGAR|nr:hypothetical protein CVT26_007095 [Gymnopilus dilepis]
MPGGHELSPLKKRRSSRLKAREVAASKPSVAPQTNSSSGSREKRRKLSDAAAALNNDRGFDEEGSSTSNTPTSSGPDRRRLKRITLAELERREKHLRLKAQDLEDRKGELEERIEALKKKEDQSSNMMMSQLAEQECQLIIKQLEEHFTCALCYEILAAPYALNPPNCGHTFCGLCILKWFFSRLHRVCGLWHESVDCPICRSLLIPTPDLTPRLQITFPFVPNRVTGSIVESLVEKLVKAPLSSQTQIKREESEDTWVSRTRKKRGRNCIQKREPSEENEDASQKPLDVTAWREGGHMRAEWLKKDRQEQGKEEMAYILKYWSTMGSQDFIALKQKLGV